MNLLRAVRPLLAARLRQAAPLRGKVSFRDKADRELVLSPTTAFVCYVISAVFGSTLLYGAYLFVVQANDRDVQRAAYFERVGLSEWKPKPWPPPENDEINAKEALAEESGEAKDAVREEDETVSTNDTQVSDKAHTESTEVKKEEDSPIEEASSGAQEEEQGAVSNAETGQTQD